MRDCHWEMLHYGSEETKLLYFKERELHFAGQNKQRLKGVELPGFTWQLCQAESQQEGNVLSLAQFGQSICGTMGMCWSALLCVSITDWRPSSCLSESSTAFTALTNPSQWLSAKGTPLQVHFCEMGMLLLLLEVPIGLARLTAIANPPSACLSYSGSDLHWDCGSEVFSDFSSTAPFHLHRCFP